MLEGAFHSGFFSTRKRSQTWCHQRLCPQDELQSPPASLGDSPRSACGSIFRLLLLPWTPECVRVCVPLLRTES